MDATTKDGETGGATPAAVRPAGATGSAGTGVEMRTLLRFLDIAVDALSAARAEIDTLNVYPVPDGDTGTNMYLTIAAAREAAQQADDPTEKVASAQALGALARGALLGARGNSGVILAELVGGVARRLATAGADEPFAEVVADALEQATASCYAAVGEPVEGTMLTVLRAAAVAAQRAVRDVTEAGGRARTGEVMEAAAAAAREALAHTPEQLEVLARAGVVDAGGRGICVLLDAAATVLTGRRPVSTPARIDDRADTAATAPAGPTGPTAPAGPTGPSPSAASGVGDLDADGPAYEVMYLLDGADDGVPHLRAALGRLGDSVVVVGGDGLWNVHVHTDDVGAVIEAGLERGRPHRIRVTHFADHAADHAAGAHACAHHTPAADASGHPSAPPPTPPTSATQATAVRRVVAVAAGPGLADLFAGAGATVVQTSPGRRASTGDLVAAITADGAQEVVVLPNDEPTVRAAQVAATTAETDDAGRRGIRVSVIPTHTQVQGLAALAVHDPAQPFETDVTEMTATARHVRHGAVTVAARTAMTMAGPCEAGDALGVISGDFAVVGSDLAEVAIAVLRSLLAPGGELVTLVGGRDGGEQIAAGVAAWVSEEYPHVDVITYEGGQDRYPLLLSVE